MLNILCTLLFGFGAILCIFNIYYAFTTRREYWNLIYVFKVVMKITLGFAIMVIVASINNSSNSKELSEKEWLQIKSKNNCKIIQENNITDENVWQCENGIIYVNKYKN